MRATAATSAMIDLFSMMIGDVEDFEGEESLSIEGEVTIEGAGLEEDLVVGIEEDGLPSIPIRILVESEEAADLAALIHKKDSAHLKVHSEALAIEERHCLAMRESGKTSLDVI